MRYLDIRSPLRTQSQARQNWPGNRYPATVQVPATPAWIGMRLISTLAGLPASRDTPCGCARSVPADLDGGLASHRGARCALAPNRYLAARTHIRPTVSSTSRLCGRRRTPRFHLWRRAKQRSPESRQPDWRGAVSRVLAASFIRHTSAAPGVPGEPPCRAFPLGQPCAHPAAIFARRRAPNWRIRCPTRPVRGAGSP